MEISEILLESSLWNLLLRFALNIVVLFILVGLIYYKFSRKENHLFSYFLIGIMIFLICAILGTKEIKMGTALGLFALIAIIRFRTVQYSAKDITYIFIIIGISVINSQANIPPPILGAVIINSMILLITWLLEIFLQKKSLVKLEVMYNNLELLKPGRENDLYKDLSRHTGQDITRVNIQRINIDKSNAEIDVFYKKKTSEVNRTTVSEDIII
jgi:hypothetical protein